MDVAWVRRYCLAMPHTTESVQWGSNLVFKVGGKIYAIAELEPADKDHWLAFKCSAEDFAELCEREDIVPGAVPGARAMGGAAIRRRRAEGGIEATAAASLRPGVRQTYRGRRKRGTL